MTIRRLIEDLTDAARVSGMETPVRVTCSNGADGVPVAVKTCSAFALVELELDPPDNEDAA